MTLASRSLGRGKITCGCDPALRLTPWLIAILDAEQRLVLAGEVSGDWIDWCRPVDSDAEARAVVIEASRMRAEAQHLADTGARQDAGAVRRQAAILEGRLVDPFWRDAALLALLAERVA
ncbi:MULTISPECIES: hypothetical protein [unclassified Haematobacter]|uniref:hypothetical protein n=1 Tax=unclassified Haematobacter TaxID=2640585 RepID=UPI0025C5DFA5|nr:MULTISPECIES: hypothetical protein [unclassified Haematobacter]